MRSSKMQTILIGNNSLPGFIYYTHSEREIQIFTLIINEIACFLFCYLKIKGPPPPIL